MLYCRWALLVFAILMLTGMAHQQAVASDDTSSVSRLVNVDGTGTTAKGFLSGGMDYRAVNPPEGIAYASLSFRWGLTSNLEVGIRGVTGTTSDFTAGNGAVIRHGGRDTELFGKYRLGNLGGVHVAVLAGASSAGTPAQNQAFGTLSGIAEVKIQDRVSLFLNPRAIFISGNTITGLGVGTAVRVSDSTHIVGDWTTIVAGDNTRSTKDGKRTRGDVWGLAVRFSSTGNNVPVDFDIGWGNSIGSTTGFSLTPGLGNSSGLYFALTAHH